MPGPFLARQKRLLIIETTTGGTKTCWPLNMTRYAKTWLLVIVIVAASTACTFHTSKQDPEKAAAVAEEFAKAALVDRDMDKAYTLLDPEVQSNAPKRKFVEILAEMNSHGSPTKVTATEFEPIAGEEGLNIYLTGENGGETFYFRVPMRGSDRKGYKPIGILRGQYAPSELKQRLHGKAG